MISKNHLSLMVLLVYACERRLLGCLAQLLWLHNHNCKGAKHCNWYIHHLWNALTQCAASCVMQLEALLRCFVQCIELPCFSLTFVVICNIDSHGILIKSTCTQLPTNFVVSIAPYPVNRFMVKLFSILSSRVSWPRMFSKCFSTVCLMSYKNTEYEI